MSIPGIISVKCKIGAPILPHLNDGIDQEILYIECDKMANQLEDEGFFVVRISFES